MAFLNIPIKSLQADVLSVQGVESMPWYNPADFPALPAQPYPSPSLKDFQWRITMDVVQQNTSSILTRGPGFYNGQDVYVGDWIANLVTGQAWQIISIESKTSDRVIAVVQDVYRYNTFRDTTKAGQGGPSLGIYVVFELSENGLPQIDPLPAAGASAAFGINLQSRFEYVNLQYDFPLYQEGNDFDVDDVIAVDPVNHVFVKASSIYKTVIGRVTSVSDTITGWFTINPNNKVVDNLDYLPGDVGDIIYTSTTVPGGLSPTPGGAELYINIRKNTQSISRSLFQGPTAPGNTFQLNGQNIVIGSPGTMASVVSATNAVASTTGVSASLQLSQTSVSTNSVIISPLYGEPILWAASTPSVATINGISVTFNITSTDSGYTSYARPEQMAQSINNANIPGITATFIGTTTLRITNITGGPITIVNVTNDRNGVPFAGNNSGSGLALNTPTSNVYVIEFVAVDSRPINFLNVIGDPVGNFGLVSVENGVKACGLYIANGLRAAGSTVVTNLAQLNALAPMIGDQAYVIDSADSQGNNVGEWSMWLYNGSVWVMTSDQSSSTTDAKSIEYTLTPSSPANVNIGRISTGRRVTLITVEVMSAFNGSATLNIGYQINNPTSPAPVPSGLMTNAVIDLNNVDTYSATTDLLFGTDTITGDVTITATFSSGGSTSGSAQIIVSYV